MNDQQVEQTIREYIPQIIHMSLATVKDNKPWVCEVHFSYDDDLNIYFASSVDSRHGQEITANPHVSANIVTQHHKDQKTRCVDFEGTATILSGEEAEKTAYQAYAKRCGASEGLLNNIRKDGNVRFFKINVENFYLTDEYSGDRNKYALTWHAEETA
ncbi:MAG: hypothetical protein JWP06_553 [Candidatus Saccharibacteria bacterium]|nr:hypothetical protein [Candidatus Saccharibacteria bacterium]